MCSNQLSYSGIRNLLFNRFGVQIYSKISFPQNYCTIFSQKMYLCKTDIHTHHDHTSFRFSMPVGWNAPTISKIRWAGLISSGLDYSFSGLKTSFLYSLRDWIKDDPDFIEHHKTDLAASLEATVVDIPVSYTHLDVYKRQRFPHAYFVFWMFAFPVPLESP